MSASTSASPAVTPERFREMFQALQQELGEVIVGQQPIVQGLLIAFFAGGHVLLEGVPGLGKTLLAKTFARTLGLSFKRVQCTPDLMPADILGTELVVDRDGHKVFEFAYGPVFTHILLADELNRATPKTQSALLEAMAEHQVSVSGKTYQLEEPFFVISTQNPIEMEGVYSLPEAQLDRFLFRLLVEYPTPQELGEILRRTTIVSAREPKQVLPQGRERGWIIQAQRLVREVLVARPVEDYVVRLVSATRPDTGDGRGAGRGAADDRDGRVGDAARFIRYGASPRGAQAILMGAKVLALVRGRVNVSFEDVDEVMLPALNHRVVLTFEAEAERRTSADILRELTASAQAGRS
jgi:MoxR-like ATPase